MPDRGEVTRLLEEIGQGKQPAVDQLYPLVYDELRRLAQRQLQNERPDHTLQATALVHEAYLRLVGQTRVRWKNHAHFFSVAAQAMRRILVDHARRGQRAKRGGDAQRITLDRILDQFSGSDAPELTDLDDALSAFAEHDPEKARIVELRFCCGLNNPEIADVLGTSTRTVERHWQYARAWLYRELKEEQE